MVKVNYVCITRDRKRNRERRWVDELKATARKTHNREDWRQLEEAFGKRQTEVVMRI